MEYNQIPNTALEVSPICLGTMTFGTPVGEKGAIKIVHWCLENGVNFIDTANIYEGYTRNIGSAGEVAERFLGVALKGKRTQAILATKVGMKVGDAPEDEGTSPEAIRIQLDKSLMRLNTEYVDIYYLHRPDPDVPMAESIGAMKEAIAAGKVRHYGISNFSAEQTKAMIKTADADNLPRPVIHQPPYSLLNPDIEKDLLPLCEKEKIGVAPYRVLQGGLLTGKYHRGVAPPKGSRREEKQEWITDYTDETFDKLENLDAEARSQGRSLMEHALKKTLTIPAVISLVIGVKRINQVEDLIRAVS